MLLADTSVWIEHLRSASFALAGCLERGEILMHPFVRGELLLGGLPAQILTELRLLPQVSVATAEEVETLIDIARLHRRGIGYVDVALLASVRLYGGAKLWTNDKRLALVASEMSIGVTP